MGWFGTGAASGRHRSSCAGFRPCQQTSTARTLADGTRSRLRSASLERLKSLPGTAVQLRLLRLAADIALAFARPAQLKPGTLSGHARMKDVAALLQGIAAVAWPVVA